MENNREAVIKNLRSFCISNKGTITVRQLIRDYMTMIGSKIPHKEYGYKTVEDFLNSEKSFRVINKGNETYVVAEATEKSAHIAQLVSRQKTDKKKPPKVRFRDTPRFRRSNSTATSKWRPSNDSRRVRQSSRLRTVNHAQFVNKNTEKKEKTSPTPTTTTTTMMMNFGEQQPKRTKTDTNYRVVANNNNNNDNNSADLTHRNSTKKSNVKKTPENNSMKNITQGASLISLKSKKNETMEFPQTSDPLNDLKRFAEIHQLGEVTVDTTKLKAAKVFYSCKIKIGDKHTYSSYPKEFKKPLEAQSYCCKQALEELIPKYTTKSLNQSTEQDILKRIPPMLEKHQHGIWSWQLKLDYSDKYKEILPDNWLEVLDSSMNVQIDKACEKYILYYCTPENVLQKGRVRHHSLPVPPDVSVPVKTVQVNEDGRVMCQIHCVMSINEIWCQEIGTEESNHYAEMYNLMQIYYQNHEAELVVNNPSLAGYYVAKYDDSYHRVRALNVKDDSVNCFFIDWGGEMYIEKKNIFYLKREFATIQAQVFVCSLYGLEDLDDIPCDSPTLSELQDLHVILELASPVAENNNSYDALPVYMTDLECGQSINQLLLHKLPLELASSNLQKASILEAYTTNITSNGDVYVQVRLQGYEYFLNLQKQVENELNSNPREKILYKITKENSMNKLYIMKTESDDKWHRLKFVDWSPFHNDKAQIYFIDQGQFDVITVSDHKIYPLEKLNDVLNIYPDQAIHLRMALDKIPNNFVELAEKLLPKDQSVLVKIVDVIDGLSLVEIFRRNADGGLFSVNRSISFEAELNIQNGEGNSKGKFKMVMSPKSPVQHSQVPSTGSLNRPKLPEIGDYFPVCIPFAVSPSNFFIQPLSSREKLDKLMEKLQKCYRNVQYGNLKLEDIKPGNIYASKHEDGFWYRTSVIKVIHSGSVSVYYCDFGFYLTVAVKQLLPLAEEFMELPYQAFKAKLAGIVPIQTKWTMEDCKKFKEMIENKRFYAMLKSIDSDILYESDIVLKLALVNTEADIDVFVASQLIENGIGLKDSSG